MLYKVIKVLYKCYTVCIYGLRIDSSGIAANTHRHLPRAKAGVVSGHVRRTVKKIKNKSMHKNTRQVITTIQKLV